MKKSISIILSFILIFTLGLTAFASGGITEDILEVESTISITDEVKPKAVTCPCGKGVLVVSYSSWGAWYNVSSSPCSHGYLFGDDVLQKRERTVTNRCSSCGYGYSSQQSESRIDCNGR